MSEPRAVLLLQCLCPARHCIIALAGEAPPATVESMTDAARATVDTAIEGKRINPFCGICKARREHWSFEVAELPGRTLAEVLPALQREEAEQVQTRERIHAEARANRN